MSGLVTEVSSDGSFALDLALAEGTNRITATATDAAGNTATTSVDVTYINPIPGVEQGLQQAQTDLANAQQRLQDAETSLDAANANVAALGNQVLLLVGLLAVFAALSGALLLQYWRLRRRVHG